MKKLFLSHTFVLCLGFLTRATVFTVLNTNDSGVGSLRAAIASANLDLTSSFNSPHIIDATGVHDTINLSSQYVINNHMVINGSTTGNVLVINGQLGTNVFQTSYTTNSFYFSITDLSVINARAVGNGSALFIDGGLTAVLKNCRFYNCATSSSGGTIFNVGNCSVYKCVFEKDSVTSVGVGSCIHNDANLFVKNSFFNQCYSNGGSVSVGAGAVAVTYIDSCVFENNFSPFAGAGVYNDGAMCKTTNSSFINNSASIGSAWFSYEVNAIDSIINCTFENNSAISSNSGTIYSEKSTMYIENCTFSKNSSNADAGALYIKSNHVKVRSSTFWGNTSNGSLGGAINIEPNDTLDIENSIIIGNDALFGGQGNDIYGAIKGNGHNIIGDTAFCKLSGATNNLVDLLDYTVIDTVLSNHGGITKTHALISCGPAINSATNNTALFDQRGLERYKQADIGSFEFQKVISLAITDTLCSTSSSYTLSATPNGGVFSGVGISGNTFSPASASIGWNLINYSYTDINNCISQETDSILVDICTGLIRDLNTTSQLYLYPNPNNGLFTVAVKEQTHIVVTDALGREVFSKEITIGTESINLSAEKNGVYFVKVTTRNYQMVKKVIIEK